MIEYFAGCRTPEEVRERYKELAKQHHPDAGGSTDTMQEINAQRDKWQAFTLFVKQLLPPIYHVKNKYFFYRLQVTYISRTSEEYIFHFVSGGYLHITPDRTDLIKQE